MVANHAPVEEGEEYYLTIEDWGKDSDPVAFVRGFVVFINGATDVELGDRVPVRITRVDSDSAQAEVRDETDEVNF